MTEPKPGDQYGVDGKLEVHKFSDTIPVTSDWVEDDVLGITPDDLFANSTPMPSGEGMCKIFGPDRLSDEELDRALAQKANESFTNSTPLPSGETPEFATATTMPRITPPQPTLEERVDNLEALMLDLFKRVQVLEAFP